MSVFILAFLKPENLCIRKQRKLSKLSNSFCYNFGKGVKTDTFLDSSQYDYQNQGIQFI